MKKNIPKISEAEWEVMKVLWVSSPRTANEIVDELTATTHWKRETIRTLVNRLVQKKAIAFRKQGRQYHYFPKVTEAEGIRAEAESFIKRIGGGPIEPMLAAFVEDKQLSAEKIAKLKSILDKAGAASKEKNSKPNR